VCRRSLLIRTWLLERCSVILHAEKGSTAPDPVVLVDLAGQVQHEDEVSRVARRGELTLPGGGLVKRALEVIAGRECHFIHNLDRFEPDDRELNDRHLRIRILHTLVLQVPLSALNVHAMDVDADFRSFCDLILHDFTHVSCKVQGVNRLSSGSSISLHGGCHEALREEERGNPEGVRRALVDPFAHEVNTVGEVLDPGG